MEPVTPQPGPGGAGEDRSSGPGGRGTKDGGAGAGGRGGWLRRMRRSRPTGPEPPASRRARLRRRRRLLLAGGVPALALAVAAAWAGVVFGLTLSANRAYAAGDYETALARHQRVAELNPWLEQWRMHFNIGTVRYSAGDLSTAQEELETALATVPQDEDVDPETGYKPPGSPECRVRYNLYLTRMALAAQAEKKGDSQAAEDQAGEAQLVAGSCQVPQPPEDEETPPPEDEETPPEESSEPSDPSDPSQEPSESSEEEPTPSSGPEDEPQQDPSAESSPGESDPDPQEEQTPQQDPSTGPSQEGSASTTPDDDRDQELRNRNGDSSGGTASPRGSGDGVDGGGYKPW